MIMFRNRKLLTVFFLVVCFSFFCTACGMECIDYSTFIISVNKTLQHTLSSSDVVGFSTYPVENEMDVKITHAVTITYTRGSGWVGELYGLGYEEYTEETISRIVDIEVPAGHTAILTISERLDTYDIVIQPTYVYKCTLHNQQWERPLTTWDLQFKSRYPESYTTYYKL